MKVLRFFYNLRHNPNYMMKKLLFILSLFGAINSHAQNVDNINIDWGFGSDPSASGNQNTDRTIEVGDTVVWTWVGTGNHNVQSDGTSSNAESFDSGATEPAPNTFQYTFNNIGSTSYRCQPHASMNGTITVVAEGTLSTSSIDFQNEFRIYPNPSADYMNVEVPKLGNQSLRLEVFDVLGKKVLTQNLNKLSSRINVSKWNSGVYLVRLTTSEDTVAPTKRFVKL